MKWALLYLVTAIVTGLYNFDQLMWTIWGAPLNPLNCAGLLGALVLLGAGVLAPIRLRASLVVGLAGAVLVWVYYGPLFVMAALSPSTFFGSIQFHLKFHDYVPVVGPVLGIPLLVLCSVHSIPALRRSRTPQIAAH